MKKVAVLHTVPSVYASFPDRIRQAIPGIVIYNSLDDFFITDTSERGVFTTINKNRLYAFLRAAGMTGADAILVTCSSLTPHVERMRQFIDAPIVTADGAMLRKALGMGDRIALAHTSSSAGQAVTESIMQEAAKTGKQPIITRYQSAEAFDAICRLDQETHDRLVMDMASTIKDADVIVIGQASMAHLEEKIQVGTGIRTLSAPELCIEELKITLGI